MTLDAKYGIVGSTGRMGLELLAAAGGKPCLTVSIEGEECSDAPQVIFDFSSAAVFNHTIELCKKYNCALVCGTTALSAEQIAELHELAKTVPVVQSSNYSIGIAIMSMILKEYGPLLEDWNAELCEIHHIHKKDAPSGTALMLRDALGRDVPIQSHRLGGIPGDHEALFGNEGELLTIRHRAINRSVFAIGAVEAAKFALSKENGFYTLTDVVKSLGKCK